MPVLVIGEFRLPPENVALARDAMERVVTSTRAEAGCLGYSYSEDVLDPGLIRVSEKWESREDLAAHLAAPHMAVWKQEREDFGLTGRAITLCDAGPEEAI
jgi:quinol monooxygenase YgiN